LKKELSMKAVRIINPHQYEIKDQEIPKPKNSEVLVKMKAAGVCGSDFHIFHGENPCTTYPLIPGHENAGIVEAIGSDITKWKVGDHVVIDLIIPCGKCWECKHDRKNVCESIKVRGSSADGGWREYLCVPETALYKVPNSIPFDVAALVEPFAIGGHACKRGRIVKDDIVLVLGSGTIGSIILQTCKIIGATVICADINNDLLQRACSYGADKIINTKDTNLLSEINKFTNNKGVTVAFDAACFTGSLTTLLQPGIIRNAGRVISMGFNNESEQISSAMIDKPEIDIIGSRMSCNQFEPTIKNLVEGKYNFKGLVSHKIPFSKINKVFDLIESHDSSIKKIVIDFEL